MRPKPTDGISVASLASLDYKDTHGLDSKLLGRITEAIQALYREENQRIGVAQSVEIAMRLYPDIVVLSEDERRGATAYALNQLRRELQAESSHPATGKSSA